MRIEDIGSRDELPQFLKNNGYLIGVEIGCNKGEFTEKLCQAGLTVYTIDPWIGFSGQGREQKKQNIQDDYYNEAIRKLNSYPNCHIIRKASMDALKDFKDDSLDFVYIDGDHNFRHIAEDVFEWSKKVRTGGIVSGHDYWNTPPYASNVVCQVKAIVDAYIDLFKIDNLKILNGDKYPSWLWTKK